MYECIILCFKVVKSATVYLYQEFMVLLFATIYLSEPILRSGGSIPGARHLFLSAGF